MGASVTNVTEPHPFDSIGDARRRSIATGVLVDPRLVAMLLVTLVSSASADVFSSTAAS
jgi:hypothetical protein